MLLATNKKLCNKSLSSSAAASTVGNNCDLLMDILYCLPGKSLCVFKTVSKQWQSLISDPYFKSNFNLRNRRLSMPALFMKKRVITSIGTKDSEFQTLVMGERNGVVCAVPSNVPISLERNRRVDFVQSCNGLVVYKVDHVTHKTYVIHNPSMNHCKTLPSPPSRKAGVSRVLDATIAFDPAKSSYYQVVSVCNAEDASRDIYHIEIYSSKTDSWREAGDPFQRTYMLYHSGVYWNGSVHWINWKTASLYYFDIDCELMKKIAMPTRPDPKLEFTWKIGYFKECRGLIHLMVMRDRDMLVFDIWELRMDYSGWNLKYYVDLSQLTTVYPSIFREEIFPFRHFELSVLLVEEGEDSSRLLLWILKDRLISFDLKNKSFKELYDAKTDVCVKGFEYMETLALVI